MKITKFAKKNDIQQNWFVIDATNQILGRMASRVALYLRGKHKPIYTPNVDTGDFIIIVNSDKIKVTEKKLIGKNYYHHTGYVGHLKQKTLKERLLANSDDVIKDAVWGMLPKNRLGRAMFKKLKVYKGDKHNHTAQKPQKIDGLVKSRHCPALNPCPVKL